MNSVEKFLKMLNTEKGSFTFTVEEYDKIRIYLCAQVSYKKARLIYISEQDAENFHSIIPAYIYAVIVNDKIYIVNPFVLGEDSIIYRTKHLSSNNNVVFLPDFLAETNRRVNETIISDYYRKLDTTGKYTLTESDREFIRETAREAVLKGAKPDYYHLTKFELYPREAERILIGETTLEYIVDKFISKFDKNFVYVKIVNEQINGLVNNPNSVTEDWERKLAAALRTADDKTVNVIFEKGDKIAKVRVNNPISLIETLIENLEIRRSTFNPVTDKEVVTNILGDNPTCKEISQISLHGKIIYSR
jgi:hypothetical protein